MNRDRTNLYLSYRKTLPRNVINNPKFESLIEEEEGLIESRKSSKKPYHDNEIEMKVLPPSIFDISKELDDKIKQIKFQTNELNSLYKKLLITRQSEKRGLETRIEELNYDITKQFEQSYVLIKKFDFIQKNYKRLNLNYSLNEISILENFKKTYAMKIQESSLIFRNLQNNYIKFLNDEDNDEEKTLLDSNSALQIDLMEDKYNENIEDYSKQILQTTQQRIQSSQTGYLAAREREISQMAMKILEISTIFKEMESLVVDQGSILDRIDFNLNQAVQDLRESDKELIKAESYQKRTTKCKIILLLVLLVFALLLLVIIRPFPHSTSKTTSPTPKPDGNEQNKPITPGDPEIKPEDPEIKPEIPNNANDIRI